MARGILSWRRNVSKNIHNLKILDFFRLQQSNYKLLNEILNRIFSTHPSRLDLATSAEAHIFHVNLSALEKTVVNKIIIKDFYKRYQKICTISNGGFGEVSKFLDLQNLNQLAVKMVYFAPSKLVDPAECKKFIENFLTEFSLVKSACKKSQYLINYRGVALGHNHFIIVSTYFENGSVKDLFKMGGLSEGLALKYFYQALKAVQILHSHSPPIIHRNIKASNLMMVSNDQIKLTDFGFLKDPTDMPLKNFPDICYIAPEIFYGLKNLDKISDVWAMGCTLVEMILTKPPYNDFYLNPKNLATQKVLKYDSQNLIPTASQSLKTILDQTLKKDPEKRSSVNSLIHFIDRLKDLNFHVAKEKEYRRIIKEAKRQAKIDDLYRDPYSDMSRKRMAFQGQKLNTVSFQKSNDEEEEEEQNKVPNRQGIIAAPMLATQLLARYEQDNAKNAKKKHTIQDLFFCFSYFWFRIFYFLCILCKTITYMLMFLSIGAITLGVFLCIAIAIVITVRTAIAWSCNNCDLNSPEKLIVSGIFMILLFAMLFSCCIMGLGEFQFRLSNKKNEDNKPDRNIKFCGVTVIKARNLKDDYPSEIHTENTAF